MPFYDFKCMNCGEIEEFYESMNNKNEHICKKCNTIMKKQFSTFQFNFKNLPRNHNLSATQRKELWNSNDIKDFRKIN